MAKNETITIKKIDTKLLEEQRKTLNKLITIIERQKKKVSDNWYIVKVVLDNNEIEALEGISNMLDNWSDENYFNKE